MRISDWSSDVCSSDLRNWQSIMREGRTGNWALEIRLGGVPQFPLPCDDDGCGEAGGGKTGQRTPGPGHHETTRSEEHTSELQSLMRISYAVFCLKKKKTHTKK